MVVPKHSLVYSISLAYQCLLVDRSRYRIQGIHTLLSFYLEQISTVELYLHGVTFECCCVSLPCNLSYGDKGIRQLWYVQNVRHLIFYSTIVSFNGKG